LVLILLPSLVASLGTLILASRILWTIAREDATPFSKSLSQVHDRWKVPRNSIMTCTTSALILGATYAGSKVAFSAIVGSFVVLSTLSYMCAILAHLLSRRSNIKPGRFWMSGPTGFIVNAVARLYMAAFIVIFCFLFSLSVTAENMNYTFIITGGLTVISTLFWFWKRKTYVGPRQVDLNVKAADIVYISEERSP
jgi:choline transport protein